ncbi:MAG TPA: hypothetical protein VJ717_15775 [Gemmatimonadaceae bacterium]|nr:hypothetical protein [Gemmatimonadaceae bacterium]
MPERVRKYYVVRFDDDIRANEIKLRLFDMAERVATSNVRYADDIVVWTTSPFSTVPELFLSDGALTLAQQAGLALRVDREIDHSDLPRHKALLVG